MDGCEKAEEDWGGHESIVALGESGARVVVGKMYDSKVLGVTKERDEFIEGSKGVGSGEALVSGWE
jgi:hypothetical protein